MEVEFAVELEKLCGLNTINIEIWNILLKYKKGNKLIISILQSFSLENNVLNFNFNTEEVELASLDIYFKDIPNIFNDPLPSQEYFDIKNNISKLEFVNPERGMNVVKKWKEALEKTRVYLGELETKILHKQQNSSQIMMLFKLQDYHGGQVLLTKKNCNLSNCSFTIENASNSFELAKSFASIVLQNYDICAEPIPPTTSVLPTWEFTNNVKLDNQTITTVSNFGWGVSSVFHSNSVTITLEVNHSNTNGYAVIGIASESTVTFPNAGYSNPRIPFFYHSISGSVNGKSGYSTFTKPITKVTLVVDKKTVAFAVNGAPQEGSWKIPSPFRILADIYHPSTTATFIQ